MRHEKKEERRWQKCVTSWGDSDGVGHYEYSLETSTGLFMFTNCFWLLLLSCFVDT